MFRTSRLIALCLLSYCVRLQHNTHVMKEYHKFDFFLVFFKSQFFQFQQNTSTLRSVWGHCPIYCLFRGLKGKDLQPLHYFPSVSQCHLTGAISAQEIRDGETVLMGCHRHVNISTSDHVFRSASVTGGRFKNTYELLNLRALKFSPVNKIRIFQCMGKIFCVEFQRYPLKFHTKYLNHTLKDMIFV